MPNSFHLLTLCRCQMALREEAAGVFLFHCFDATSYFALCVSHSILYRKFPCVINTLGRPSCQLDNAQRNILLCKNGTGGWHHVRVTICVCARTSVDVFRLFFSIYFFCIAKSSSLSSRTSIRLSRRQWQWKKVDQHYIRIYPYGDDLFNSPNPLCCPQSNSPTHVPFNFAFWNNLILTNIYCIWVSGKCNKEYI